MKKFYLLAVASIGFLIFACNQNKPSIHLKSREPVAAAIVKTDLAGKKFLYDFNTRYIEITVKDDSILNWKIIAGKEKGVTEDVRYYRHNVSKGIIMLSWTDKERRSVSQVINFNTDSVKTFIQDKNKIISVDGSVQLIDTPKQAVGQIKKS